MLLLSGSEARIIRDENGDIAHIAPLDEGFNELAADNNIFKETKRHRTNDLPHEENNNEEEDGIDQESIIKEVKRYRTNDLPYRDTDDEDNSITTGNNMLIDVKRADQGVFDAASLV